MANTMDSILVDYEQFAKQKKAPLKKQRVPLPVFLDIQPYRLSKTQQKIQKALVFIYKQNNKNPPLFDQFSGWFPNKPLVIDCVPISNSDNSSTMAYFNATHNTIYLKNIKESSDLTEIFAHELKHANQSTSEEFQLHCAYFKTNAYLYHQLRFLEEAQAFIFGNYISMLQHKQLNIKALEKRIDEAITYKSDLFHGFRYYAKDGSVTRMVGIKDYFEEHPDITQWNYTDFEAFMLPSMYLLVQKAEMFSYKNDFDLIAPIKRKDVNDVLSNTQSFTIPASFHIQPNLSDWRVIPLARTPRTRLKQLMTDPDENGMVSPEDMKLIEDTNQRKYGDYILNDADKSDYISLLLSRGQIGKVSTLFQDEHFVNRKEQSKHIAGYVRQRSISNLPLTSDEMEFIELKDEKGSFVFSEAFSYYKRSYINLLASRGQFKQIAKLFSDTQFLDDNSKSHCLLNKSGEFFKIVAPQTTLTNWQSTVNQILKQITLCESQDEQRDFLYTLLELKDGNGRYVVNHQTIYSFKKDAQKNNASSVLKLLAAWQQQHPSDYRFIAHPMISFNFLKHEDRQY